MHASRSQAASKWLAPFCAALLCLAPIPAAAESTAHALVRGETAHALIRDGLRYENAEGVPRDYAKALEAYCAAARSDDADAYLRMGWMYANARGLARDDQVANTLFRRAAALGNEAAARLAQMVRSENSHDKLPACLTPPAPPADPTQRADGLMPFVDQAAALGWIPVSARRELVGSVVRLADEFHLDPRLVLAVLRAESNFDPLARSPKNAQGLMQLIPETAERFAVRNAFDPVQNLRGGMRYLRWLLSYFKGDVTLALAGYNAGEGAVNRARGVPSYPETRAYVQRIRALYPHDYHPFDTRVTDPPPWLQRRAHQATLETQETKRSR